MRIGIMEAIPIKLWMLVCILQMLGVFMTCMETFMNGRQIGMHHTHPMPKPTPKALLPAAGRSNRGGSWTFDGTHLPVARRFSNLPTDRFNYIGFRLAYRQITMPPTDLNFTAPLAIAENQPIGAVVGEFNATDPDAGATLTYSLLSGRRRRKQFPLYARSKRYPQDRHHL